MQDSKRIRNVGIVGAGLMGSGIAEVCAQAGYQTLLVKASGGNPGPARSRIESSLNKRKERGKISAEDLDATLSRLEVTGDREKLAQADIIIECIVEDLATKQKLFAELCELASADCIFASNTSTLKIADLAPSAAAARTIGLHFFSPVPAMRLVELAHLETTDGGVIADATNFVESLGKTCIPVVDSSGFIVNRLLVPYLVGAIAAYGQGLAPAENIDAAMSLGCSHPVGPLFLCDLIGLDIVYAMATLLYEDFSEDRYQPPALLKELVEAGHVGRKSGRGFYDHSQKPSVPDAALWQRICADKRRTSQV